MKTEPRRWPALAALATLALHGAIVLAVDMPDTFRKYTLAAEQHLAGELPGERLADLSPLYFELAVAVARVFPRPDPVLVGLQVVLVAVAAGLLARLLERRCGRPMAMAGVAVLALDRHVLVYERVLEPEACMFFFVVGWIFFVERSVAQSRPERSFSAPVLAGILAGASLVTRPTFLPLFLLVPLYLRARAQRRWQRDSLAYGAPVAAALVVLLLRAAAVTGDPTSPVMNPGTVFYEGNNPLSRGTSAIYPPVVRGLMGPRDERPDAAHVHYRTVARAATGEELSVAEVNAYWSGLAMAYVRAEPGRFAELLQEKLLRIFHGYRWHDVPAAWRYDRRLGLPHLPFAILAALALLGMLFEVRRRPAPVLFYALAAMQVAVMLTFYVSARQRLVILPALVYFALAAAGVLAAEARRRPFRRALPLAAVAALLALVFVVPSDLARDDRHVRERNVVAQALFDALREAAAREPLAAHVDLALDALAQAPWVEWVPAYFPQVERGLPEALAERLEETERASAPARFDFALVLMRAGRLDEAEAILTSLAADRREVYRGANNPSVPRFYLARIAALSGDRERAVALLEEALGRAPGDPFVLAELIALTDDPRHQESLLATASVIDAQYLLGRALSFHGRANEAAAAFGFVVARLPRFRTGRIHLAAALGAAGRVDEGAREYLEAVREEPDPLLLSEPVSELFRRWAARHPGDARVRFYAAHVLHEHGRFREALELLQGLEPGGRMGRAVAAERERIRRSLEALRDSD